jgi:predicted nucleic acid-binding protein
VIGRRSTISRTFRREPVEREIAEIQRRNDPKDALIGATAKWDKATLVTEDRRFARDASARGIAVLTWSQFLARLRAIHV